MTAWIDAIKTLPIAADANARLKAWKVERDASATRRRYAALAAMNRLAVPAGRELEAALSQRIGERRRALGWPKPFGDLHLFLVYSVTNWEAVLPRALAPFGEVTEFEWLSRGFDHAASDWIRRRESMNRELLAAFDAANRRRPVDVIVGYCSGYTVGPEVLRDIAARGAVTTNFCFDDKICWPGHRLGGRYASTASIADAIDLNLTSDPEGMVRYAAHGGLALFHPEAADPQRYRPLDVPFEYDVSFVGACYGWRPRLVDGLRRRGIEVACFGKGWPRGSIANEDMNGIYARSRINLGCGGIGYSKKLLCLKGRDFEVPMSGAIYLTQNNPELREVFHVGREILVYDDIGDCATTIRTLLSDDDRAERIRMAARARCVADHTYTARWTRVFGELGALAMEERPQAPVTTALPA